jgi:hypothetical protein
MWIRTVSFLRDKQKEAFSVCHITSCCPMEWSGALWAMMMILLVSKENIKVWSRSVWSARMNTLENVSVNTYYRCVCIPHCGFTNLPSPLAFPLFRKITTCCTACNLHIYCALYTSMWHACMIQYFVSIWLLCYVLNYILSVRNGFKVS